jgi:fatty acid synthase
VFYHCSGVKDPSSINKDATLGELGLDSLMGVEVKQTLERDYDLTLPMQEIRSLTLDKLRNISSGMAKSSSDHGKSAGVDIEKVSRRFNPKQLMPSETLIQLSEGDKTHGLLFVVHPIEGVLVALQPVMTKVKRTVYGIQCTRDAPNDSIANLSAYYLQVRSTWSILKVGLWHSKLIKVILEIY